MAELGSAVASFRRLLAGLPGPYLRLAIAWYGLYAVTTLVHAPAKPLSLVLAATCFGLLLLRPAREVPLALLLLATTLQDELIYLGATLAWFRVARGEIAVGNAIAIKTLLGLGFLVSIALSLVVGFDPADFRPWQALFWLMTFGGPLSLQFLRPPPGRHGPVDTAGFALFLMVMQLPLLALQGMPDRFAVGDAFLGIGAGANVVGFWATVMAVGALAAIVLRTGRVRSASWWVLSLGILMTWLPEAKVYSGLVLAAGMALVGWSALWRLPGRRAALFVSFSLCAALLAGTLAWRSWQSVGDWADLLLWESKKVQFLSRTFGDSGGVVDPLFGAGPGMLGSRAANMVSGDIQFKERDTTFLPAFLRDNAPRPQRWAMRDLWDESLALTIRWMSATIAMPFSGLGAMKGELGWSGLLLFSGLLAACAQSVLPGRLRQCPLEFGIRYAVAAGILATLPIALFDTIWEMPKFMVPLGALAMACATARS